ncbi:MAG TPA: signal peptide peptidase SppA [Planctomycetaceae bacterium]|nr:signal peptide peptidase SppA [Planctomycetaceae bacterium]
MNTPTTTPPTIIVRTSGGFFSRLAGAICWLLLFGFIYSIWTGNSEMVSWSGNMGGLTETHQSGNTKANSKVAILTISGIIGDGHGYVKQQIDQIRRDSQVKAIVLRVNSPGGTVYGSDFILHHLKKLREERDLPLVVSMGGMATSGGYYVSMAIGDQKDVLFAEPTTTTGSIGVILPHYDFSQLLKRYDVQNDAIVSHPRKQMLSMTRSLSDEHRSILQAQVDELFSRFKFVVRGGRPALRDDPEQLNRIATGEVFTANQALDHGLIDKIGFLEDAIERASQLANLKSNQFQVVQYQRPGSLFNLIGMARTEPASATLQTLLDPLTPRAYFLFTNLPPLVSAYQPFN